MRANPWKTLAFCLIAALAVTAFAQPATAGSGDEKVRVKKIVKCKDGDCTETVENLGDGENVEIRTIQCDGEDCKEHEGAHRMVFVGNHGDDMAKHVKIRRIECDGENCEEHEGGHKMVFVGDDGDVESMTGGDGHAWVSHAGSFGGGFLGVGLTELTDELRTHFGVAEGSGVMVSKVIDDGAAFKAGLEVGDIITSVDGEEVSGGNSLGRMIRSHGNGEEVVLNVWRGGAALSITAAVEERKGGLHAEHMQGLHGRMGDMHKTMRKVVVHCDDEDSDCDTNIDIAGLDDFDCGSDECKVKVQCDEGECTCTVNGESVDCEGIPGFSVHGH